MRIWFVVDWYEYWLEPDFTVMQNGQLALHGCRLYGTTGLYLGYWPRENIPLNVGRQLRAIIKQHRAKEANRGTAGTIDARTRK